MPNFSANLGLLWPDRPLLQRIEAAARAGFRAIELHWPYSTPATDVRWLCREHGLQLLGINTPPGDLSQGERGLGALPGREEDFRRAFDAAIEYCVLAGGTAVHVMAGIVPPAQRAAARKVFVANLRKAAARAAIHDLTLLLEPLNPRDNPGYFYSTVAEGIDLIEELGSANVKLQFDVYHVGVTEGDVLTKLRAHLPQIGHVQVAAVPSRAEPDEGEIAYRAIFDELDRLGYSGWVGCEYHPRASTEAGLAWVQRLGVEL